MNMIPRRSTFTFDEFCLLTGDRKADLIDGVIYMASPENTEAADLYGWLFRIIGDYVEEQGLGKIYGSRVAFKLAEDQSPEPDIAFVSTARLTNVRPGHVQGPPDLAIEIVSPDSIERDYVKKREQYRTAGVREYWIIDEITHSVLLLRLSARGSYRAVKPVKGVLHSQALPGFWLRTNWLWQGPRPKVLDVLKQLLGT